MNHVNALRELRDTGDVSNWQAMEAALDAAIAALEAGRSPITKIRIPTDGMEQEFQTHYRRGYEAGKRDAAGRSGEAVAWRVSIAGEWCYRFRREDAVRERAEYEADHAPDVDHEEPEPLYAAAPQQPTGRSGEDPWPTIQARLRLAVEHGDAHGWYVARNELLGIIGSDYAAAHQQPAGRYPMDASYTPKAYRQQPAPSVSEGFKSPAWAPPYPDATKDPFNVMMQPPTAPSVSEGPDYPDGCDHEGFKGGCERMGHTTATCPYVSEPAASGCVSVPRTELNSMFRAIVDAGGWTTIARHGVEREQEAFLRAVMPGLIAIELALHPERRDDFPTGNRAAASGAVASLLVRLDACAECEQAPLAPLLSDAAAMIRRLTTSGQGEPDGWNIRRRNGGLLVTGPGGMTTFVNGSLEAGGITGIVLHALAKDLLASKAQITTGQEDVS